MLFNILWFQICKACTNEDFIKSMKVGLLSIKDVEVVVAK
jgi:hypothetical protein